MTLSGVVIEDRMELERLIREVLIASTDIVPAGGEPYVGWSMVLTERIVTAMETGDPDVF